MLELSGEFGNIADKHYYLGEIVGVDDNNDVADVILYKEIKLDTKAGQELKKKIRINEVPIKYICPSNQEGQLNNRGAVIGAAAAFDIGDDVIVKEENGEYFIISHKEPPQPCLPSQFKFAIEDGGKFRWFAFDVKNGQVVNMVELETVSGSGDFTFESFKGAKGFLNTGNNHFSDLQNFYAYQYRLVYQYRSEIDDYVYYTDPRSPEKAVFPWPSQVKNERTDGRPKSTSFSTSVITPHGKTLDIYTFTTFFHPTIYPEARTAEFKQVWGYMQDVGFFPLFCAGVDYSQWKDTSTETGDVGHCIPSDELLGGFEFEKDKMIFYASRIGRGYNPSTPCPEYLKITYKLKPIKNEYGDVISWQYEVIEFLNQPAQPVDWFVYECPGSPPEWFNPKFDILRYKSSALYYGALNIWIKGHLSLDLDNPGEFKAVPYEVYTWEGVNIYDNSTDTRHAEEYQIFKVGNTKLTGKLTRDIQYSGNSAVSATYQAQGYNWAFPFSDYRLESKDTNEGDNQHSNLFPYRPIISIIYNDIDLFNSYPIFNFSTYSESDISNLTYTLTETGTINYYWDDFGLAFTKGHLNNGDILTPDYQIKYSFIKTPRGRKLIFHNFNGNTKYVLEVGGKDISKSLDEWLFKVAGISFNPEKVLGFWLSYRGEATG